MGGAVVRRLRPGFRVDLSRTLFGAGHGGLDPTQHLRRDRAGLGLRTPDGPALLVLLAAGDEIEAMAWGSGAGWALDHAGAISGADDRADGFAPADPRVAELWRRHPGARVPRTTLVASALMAVVFGQRVATEDGARAYRAAVRTWSEPAPGPSDLWLPLDPQVMAEQPYFAFQAFGVERHRAETVRRIAASARRLDALAADDVDPADARRRMQVLPGVGPWSAGTVGFYALGDPDAFALGDLHLKHLVARALAGKRWGTEDLLLELLEPYAGHRGRVCQLVVTTQAPSR